MKDQRIGLFGWLVIAGMAATGIYGIYLLVMSYLHIDPCSLHGKHSRSEHV